MPTPNPQPEKMKSSSRWLLVMFALLALAASRPVPAQQPAPVQQKESTIQLYGIYSSSDGRKGLNISINFDQVVDLSELKAHLVIKPAVPNMKIELRNHTSFSILGALHSKQSYELTITPGLKDKSGAVLTHPLSRTVTTENALPYLGFDQSGKYYFPRRVGTGLNLEARNLKEAEVKIYRLFPSNIMLALGGLNDGNGSSEFNNSWCEEVGKFKLNLTYLQDSLTSTPVQVLSRLPKDKRGVFYLEAKSSGDDNERRENDSKIVLSTNIGVLAHWQAKELVLFAHDLATLKSIPLAKVSVYSTKNQLLGQQRTNFHGVAHFKDFKKTMGEPKVAVVEFCDDYTFLELTPRTEDNQYVDESLPLYARDDYDGFLYADRELYRPGDMVHLRWMVRKNYGDVPAKVPLLLEVIKPNGKSLLSKPMVLSPLGTGNLDLPTQKTYPTGTYTVNLAVPGEDKKIVGSYTFYLEEFVPSRMKAAVSVNEERWLAGKEYEIKVNGQHLFGAPAADRKAEAMLILGEGGWTLDKWKGYRFGNDTKFTGRSISCGQQKTDANGDALFRYAYQAPAELTFPVKASVVGQVFEVSGRKISAKKEITIFPSAVCLGIAASPASGGGGIIVSAAAVATDGSPAPLGKVTVALERQIWSYYARRYYGRYESDWGESYETVESREVILKEGQGSILFKTAGDYGYYRVRVSSAQTPQFSTLSFYSYDGECGVVDASRPSLIKLSPDKSSYDAGDTADIRIESPFDGRALVVLQGDSFQECMSVDVKNKVGHAKFKMKSDYFPGVWVEVTVVHSITKAPMLVSPFSSFAMTSLPIKDRKRQLQIAFPTLPKEIRPGTAAKFDVQVLGGNGKPVQAELTLAAVDEGIHLMTGYKTPDPYAWLSRTRRPVLLRNHYYDKVAYDFEKPAAGGSEDESEYGKRLGASAESWIKTVALWSGTVQTDGHGRATISMTIPEYTGQLRLVAVACNAEALGSHSEQLFVRRPYMLQTSLPRFLLPGDSCKSRSVLFNNSDKPCQARVSWAASGALATSKGEAILNIPAHKEAALAAQFAASSVTGQGIIRWDVRILDPEGKPLDHLTQEDPIPVSTPAAFQTFHDLLILKPGESRELHNTRVQETDLAQMKVTAGADVLLRLQEALGFVVGYPYGCVEQTTSKLLPLYLLRQTKPLVGSVLEADPRTLDDYIQAGINRLFSMQTPSGGLGFWPGDSEPYLYGSIYALHCLTLIKNDRQIEVPEENFKALQKFVRKIASDWTFDYDSALYQRAYAIYVLALDGDIEAIQQIERFDKLNIPRPARYLLAAALARNTKDPERVRRYLATAPSKPYTTYEYEGTLNSAIRGSAIELLAMREINEQPARMAEKAHELVSYLEHHHYGTTQETAFVITALSGYLTDVTKNIGGASATLTDPAGKESKITGSQVCEKSAKGKGLVFKVANTGQGELYVNVMTQGIPLKPETEATSHGLAISRTLLTSNGNVLDKPLYKQTESYIVQLTITCTAEVKNLIIADLLPAGFEIENPRLSPSALPSGLAEGSSHPSHLEIRDDRLILGFSELTAGDHYFYYLVRVVTPGRFQYPPVEGECMYDPATRGRGAATQIEISPAVF